jgi:hypothetical protein
MSLRYAGFEQAQNKRCYKFECGEEGRPANRVLVSVDMALFLKHRVSIQEGPALSAQKLAADLEANMAGEHELTNDDMLAYTANRAAKEAQRAESRRPGPRRTPRPQTAERPQVAEAKSWLR